MNCKMVTHEMLHNTLQQLSLTDLDDNSVLSALKVCRKFVNSVDDALHLIKCSGYGKLLQILRHCFDEFRAQQYSLTAATFSSVSTSSRSTSKADHNSAISSGSKLGYVTESCMAVIANCCFVTPEASRVFYAEKLILPLFEFLKILQNVSTLTFDCLMSTAIRLLSNLCFSKDCALGVAKLNNSAAGGMEVAKEIFESSHVTMKTREHCLRLFRNFCLHGDNFLRKALTVDIAYSLGKCFAPQNADDEHSASTSSYSELNFNSFGVEFKLKALNVLVNLAKTKDSIIGIQLLQANCLPQLVELVRSDTAQANPNRQLCTPAFELTLLLSEHSHMRIELAKLGMIELLSDKLVSEGATTAPLKHAYGELRLLETLTHYCKDAFCRLKIRELGLIPILVDKFSSAEPCSEASAVIAASFLSFIYDQSGQQMFLEQPEFLPSLFRVLEVYTQKHLCEHGKLLPMTVSQSVDPVLPVHSPVFLTEEYRPDSPSYRELIDRIKNKSDWEDSPSLHKNFLSASAADWSYTPVSPSSPGSRSPGGPCSSSSSNSLKSFLSLSGSSSPKSPSGSPNFSSPSHSGIGSPVDYNFSDLHFFENPRNELLYQETISWQGGYSPDSSMSFGAEFTVRSISESSASDPSMSPTLDSEPADGGFGDKETVSMLASSKRKLPNSNSSEAKRVKMSYKPCPCLSDTWGDISVAESSRLEASDRCLDSVLTYISWLSHNTTSGQLLVKPERLKCLLDYVAKSCNPNQRCCRILKRLIKEPLFLQILLTMEFHFMITDALCGSTSRTVCPLLRQKDQVLDLSSHLSCIRCRRNCKIGCELFQDFRLKVDCEYASGILAHWLASKVQEDKLRSALAVCHLTKQRHWKRRLLIEYRALDVVMTEILGLNFVSLDQEDTCNRAVGALVSCCDQKKLATFTASCTRGDGEEPSGSSCCCVNATELASDVVTFRVSGHNADAGILSYYGWKSEECFELKYSKTFLAERAPVYAAMFQGSFKEAQESLFEVDVSFNAFLYFMHHLHGCNRNCPVIKGLNLSLADCSYLVDMADQHILKDLLDDFVDHHITKLLDKSNFIEFAKLGLLHRLKKLYSMAFGFCFSKASTAKFSTANYMSKLIAQLLQELHKENYLNDFLDWYKNCM